MQLPVTGHPLHTRSLTTVVSQRDDGRLRVRGDVNDLRKCGFVPMLSGIQPAGIIHQMHIELAVDPATRRIESLETGQPFVAVEPTEWTKGECCRDPAPRLEALIGEPLDADFAKKLSAVFGGPRGCSHLLTLFQLMASALPRALDREARVLGEAGAARRPDERIFWRSLFLDGYEADGGAIELAVQLHDFHSRPGEDPKRPLDRFALHDELRVFARVETPGLLLSELRAFERIRERGTLASAAWNCRDAEVEALVGEPIIPGLAGKVFRRFGDAEATAVLRDALLQLAPGQIQVMAAITDRWFAGAGDESGAEKSEGGPPAGAVGGMVDSCYIWRADGPLGDARARWKQRSPAETPGD